MSDPPTFFVPNASQEAQEATYAGLAARCNRPVPPAGERIYSISFEHNGEVWQATVGQTLSGTKVKTRKVKGRTISNEHALSDPAMVLAIFPGSPFVVVTNRGLVEGVRSQWENPFLAGRPRTIRRFSDSVA